MPAISTIADMVTATLPTFERGKWDSVGLAQLYPELEVIKQFITAREKLEDMSYLIDTSLEIAAPSSYEHSYTNHPAETAAHQLLKRIQTPLCKVRTSLTFADDEKELQGKSDSQILDIVQVRMNKWRRDYWQGVEHDFLSQPTGPTQHPDRLRGVNFWVTAKAAIAANEFDMNGGDDPTGFPAGAGGVTKADEPLWPNAVAKFAAVSQDDLFDKIDQFLNRVKTQAVVPHPSNAPEVPQRVGYTIDPIKRAIGRFLAASNDDTGNDAGVYRDACFYKSIPFTIWHAMGDPSSPVKASTGKIKLIDWNTFMYQTHSAFNQKITGPVMLPNIPGQMVMYKETWHGLHCVRRDRNLDLVTDTTELQPTAT